MNERVVATGLFLLPFLYLAALVLPVFPASDLGVYFAFGTCVAIALILGLGGSTGQLVAVALDIVLVVLVVAALIGASALGGLASELTAGVLVGLPFLVSALAWRERSGVAHRTVALAVALTVGTALLAARQSVLSSGSGGTSTNFVQAFFTVNVTQAQGLVTIAAGVGGPDLPLRGAFDSGFAALSALAVGGVLLLILRPRSGLEEALPVAATIDGRVPRSRVDRLIPFSEAQRRVFESRSSNEPPTGTWPPGLGSVLAAAIVAVGFVAVAFATPLFTPLLLAIGVAGGLAAVGLASARGRFGGPRPTA
jgi:hypothetical protein